MKHMLSEYKISTREDKLAEIEHDLEETEACSKKENEKLATFKQLSAEHKLAVQMMNKFEESYQKCENMDGLPGFAALYEKVSVIWWALYNFKFELEAATSKAKDSIDKQNEHITYLEETRDSVLKITDVVQLVHVCLLWPEWLWQHPGLELEPEEGLDEKWNRWDLKNHIMDLPHELKKLTLEVTTANK